MKSILTALIMFVTGSAIASPFIQTRYDTNTDAVAAAIVTNQATTAAQGVVATNQPAIALSASNNAATGIPLADTNFVITSIATAPFISVTAGSPASTVNATNTLNFPQGIQVANTNNGIKWGIDPVLGLTFGWTNFISVATNTIPTGVFCTSPTLSVFNNIWFTNTSNGNVLLSSFNSTVWITNYNGYWHACVANGAIEQATNATLYGIYGPTGIGSTLTVFPVVDRGNFGSRFLNDTNALPPASVVGAGNLWLQASNGTMWFRTTADGSAITDSHVP